MSVCCICGNCLKIGFKVSEDSIGTPPIIIRELIQQCVGAEFMIMDNNKICKKCFGKLKIYYKAKLEMQLMQKDLIELLSCFTKRQRDNEICNSNGKIKEEVVPFLEVQMIENQSDCIKKEIIDEAVDALSTRVEANKSEFDVYKCSQPSNKKCQLKPKEVTDIKTEFTGKLSCHDEDEICHTECTDKKKKSSKKKVVGSHTSGSVCDLCGKKFYSYTGFMYHYRTHDPVKQFKCSICSESYRDKYRLKTHMAYHTGETPFECDICGKKFVHKTSLKKHKEIHDEKTRRIECSQCDFKFRTKSHLRRHMVTHTGAKPFPCPVCDKSFSTNYGMKLHLREHENPGSTRQQRYRCKMCPRTFTNKQNFEEHCERKECTTASQ